MVDWSLLPRGILIGLSVAAPVGPMSVLCIRRTLSNGRLLGLVSGLGVALADAFFGGVAAFGLTSVSNILVDHQNVIRLVGGAFLIYLGLRTLRSRAADLSQTRPEGPRGSLIALGSTLGLTLTNPLTILSFAAIFAGFGFANEKRGGASAGLLVAGVFAGSMFWWIVLTSAVTALRGKLTTGRLTWVNRVSGAIVLIFGVIAIFSVIT
jgi:threonine/homoserine/homoserine lactone efflux protein